MIACYDLATRPCSFDFVTWLVIAKTKGVTHVRFNWGGYWKHKDYSNPKERFESILLPACHLAGMECSVGPSQGVEFGHFIGDLIRTWREFGRLYKFGTPKSEGYVTVTLRNSRKEYRNSNTEAWHRFSEDIKAVVVPDFEDKPISLKERLKLYEGARLNLFVNNGPAMLCICSDIPYAVLKYANKGGATNETWLAGQGLPRGSQYPWARKDQRIFWEGDSFEDIKAAYEEMNERQGFCQPV